MSEKMTKESRYLNCYEEYEIRDLAKQYYESDKVKEFMKNFVKKKEVITFLLTNGNKF